MYHDLNDRNEAGILTARKDLDYIGRDELLEALKRVGGFSATFWRAIIFFLMMCLMLFWCSIMLSYESYEFAAKGNF